MYGPRPLVRISIIVLHLSVIIFSSSRGPHQIGLNVRPSVDPSVLLVKMYPPREWNYGSKVVLIWGKHFS